jgi:hypothetical protein
MSMGIKYSHFLTYENIKLRNYVKKIME